MVGGPTRHHLHGVGHEVVTGVEASGRLEGERALYLLLSHRDNSIALVLFQV